MKNFKGCCKYDDMVTYIADSISGQTFSDEWEKELKTYLIGLGEDVREKLTHVEDLDNYD